MTSLCKSSECSFRFAVSATLCLYLSAHFVACCLTNTNNIGELLSSGAALDEELLVQRLGKINFNVRPVNNSLSAVNVTLDITFYGVIEMVGNIIYCLYIGYYL